MPERRFQSEWGVGSDTTTVRTLLTEGEGFKTSSADHLIPLEIESERQLDPLPLIGPENELSDDVRNGQDTSGSAFLRLRTRFEEVLLPLIRAHRKVIDLDTAVPFTQRTKLASQQSSLLEQIRDQRRRLQQISTYLASHPGQADAIDHAQRILNLTLPSLQARYEQITLRIQALGPYQLRDRAGSTMSRAIIDVMRSYYAQEKLSWNRARAFALLEQALRQHHGKESSQNLLAGLAAELAAIDLFERIGATVELASPDEDIWYACDLKVNLNGLRNPDGEQPALDQPYLLFLQVKSLPAVSTTTPIHIFETPDQIKQVVSSLIRTECLYANSKTVKQKATRLQRGLLRLFQYAQQNEQGHAALLALSSHRSASQSPLIDPKVGLLNVNQPAGQAYMIQVWEQLYARFGQSQLQQDEGWPTNTLDE